jgi:uncharacterized coiled-coil protein SlyX
MKSQQGMIEELQSTVAALQCALAKQAAQLQQVNDRLDSTSPAPRLVGNR